uniref:Uncharacterized protein n=1 Tax=Anguilla anguilla TaxID=7936 RepID=A0A0E9T8P6_ANGAN
MRVSTFTQTEREKKSYCILTIAQRGNKSYGMLRNMQI